MHRRRFVATIATTGAAILAGCSEESGGGTETEGAGVTSASTAASTTAPATPSSNSTSTTSESTQTTTEDETSTATETATETETDTETETENTNESGDSSPLPGTSETLSATVTRVVDGDTFEVRLADGTEDTVRLLGVDTPETYSENEPDEYGLPKTIAAKDHLAAWGDRATSFAADRLEGADVTIGIDPESDRRGSYGRLLCYLYYDGETNFNLELLEEGLARVYPSMFSLRSEFESAEETARSNELGLWDFDGGSGSTQTPTATETVSSERGDFPPPSGDSSDPYDCSDFDTQQQAQEYFDSVAGDPSGLDSDDNGEACESLP